jgi:hypothetical protein
MTLARDFSRQHRIIHFTRSGSASGLRHCGPRIYLRPALHPYPRTTTAWAGLPSCVIPSLAYYQPGSHASPDFTRRIIRLGVLSMKLIQHGRVTAGTGISTRCPSTTPVGLALGPDLPWADEPAPGTLGHPAEGFPTPLSLLMPAFSLVRRPRLAPAAASPPARRSPTQPHTCTQPAEPNWTRYPRDCHGFGGVLEPRYIVGAESLDQ